MALKARNRSVRGARRSSAFFGNALAPGNPVRPKSSPRLRGRATTLVTRWVIMNDTYSQGLQDLRLHRIFRALGIYIGTYVELGFPAMQTSNTERLRRAGWDGVRFDGQCLKNATADAAANCQRAWIRSDNVLALIRGSVGLNVTYVSIDIDTVDLWVLRALLKGGLRPAVFTVEYNSNYPIEFAIAFPDSIHDDAHTRKWDGGTVLGNRMLGASIRRPRPRVPRNRGVPQTATWDPLRVRSRPPRVSMVTSSLMWSLYALRGVNPREVAPEL